APIRARGRLDDMRKKTPLLRIGLEVVDITQVLAARLHVLTQIVVGSIRDAFELALPERKAILDVRAACRIMRKLRSVVLTKREVFRTDPEADVPLVASVAPIAIPMRRLLRPTEELDLHLLELAASEDEIARIDLVAKGLADLTDSERHTHTSGVATVLEVVENPLHRLGSQIGNTRAVLERTDVRIV